MTSEAPTRAANTLTLNQKTYSGDFANTVRSCIAKIDVHLFGDEEWILVPKEHVSVLDKMHATPIRLKDLPISINYGIKTGLDKAFIVDTAERNRLVSEDASSKEILKPILRGRDIRAYSAEWKNLWLIVAHNGVKEIGLRRVDINKYKAVKRYMDRFNSELFSRADQGDTPYNLRNCAYLMDFAKPKIVYPNMTTRFPFMLDTGGVLVNPKCYILTADKPLYFLKYLTGVFNSKTTKLWIWYYCPELNGGAREIHKMCFERLPLPESSQGQQKEISELVDSILTAKKTDPAADTSALEAEIDQLVYKLYGLTDEEIAVVEGREESNVKSEESRTVRASAKGRNATVPEPPTDDEEILE